MISYLRQLIRRYPYTIVTIVLVLLASAWIAWRGSHQ